MEMGRALLRDALSYERPSRLVEEFNVAVENEMEGLAGPLPPVPEPSDYSRPISPSDSNRTEPREARRTLDRSLSYDYGTDLIPAPSRAGVLSLSDRSSYSSRFAPAYRFGEPDSGSSNVDRLISSLMNRVRSPISSSLLPDTQPSNDSTNDDVEASASQASRPTNPAGNGSSLSGRTSEEARTAAIDGLGDRERSLSPEDNWETLLMTITPDNQLPSADSSFTSATASASSMPSQATSTSTSITTPEEADVSPICDLLTSSDSEDVSMTETEPDDDWVVRYAARRRQTRLAGQDLQESSTNAGSTGLEQRRRRERLNNHHTHQRRPGHRRLNDAEFDRLVDELNLRDMHRILDTLARREDIPDDWWAAVGLSRNLPPSLS